MCARWRWASGWRPARAWSPRRAAGSRTSSSTSSSRAPPPAPRRISPARSTRWAGTWTPSPRRSTPASTCRCSTSTCRSRWISSPTSCMRPRFAADDIEKEKAVVLQEIKMVEDTPDDLIHDLFAERFWAEHPLGRPILGRWDVVRGFDRDTILRHFDEEYVPARIIVAVAGHVEHERVVDLFAARFEGFARPPRPHASTRPPTPHPGSTWCSKPLEQVHLVHGLPGCLRRRRRERYALYLLNDVIGGSMSSRLFQEIRERQALVYSVHSGTQAYRDTGVFYVYAGTDPANFGKVLQGPDEGDPRPQEGRGHRGRAPAGEGSSEGQPDALAESTSTRMNRLASRRCASARSYSWTRCLAAIDAVRPDEVAGAHPPRARRGAARAHDARAGGPRHLPRSLPLLGGGPRHDRALHASGDGPRSGARRRSTRPGCGSSWRCARSTRAAAASPPTRSAASGPRRGRHPRASTRSRSAPPATT